MNTITKTVTFFGSCAANSSLVLSSSRISSPFTVRTIKASFALNTNRLLQLKFFISPDPSCPTTGEPTGFNILEEYGQVSYIVGDDEQKVLDHNAESQTFPKWLKVYAVNSDGFEHTVDVQITIELSDKG
ncbi:MAG: hypothetical protein M0R06_10550 [Sphaerochaeta sp.]|jgi:hypothetical protein|nr:hypothetical protein [Sphaerochaeta sp.]